jgi:Tfp pilus assembly pilus retraction ATPase PilT
LVSQWEWNWEIKKMIISSEDIEKSLEFSDVYLVRKNWKESYFFKQDSLGNHNISEANIEVFKQLFSEILKSFKRYPNRKDHMVIYHGRYFRCSEVGGINGGIIACRQMPKKFITLKETSINRRTVDELMSPRLNKGGLIFICGAPGNGKTTSCAALIKARLEEFGGLCITVEDPPEIPLDGKHGDGTCIQTQVDSQYVFADAIRASMRAYPTGQNNSMLIGEIRDRETATEALKAAIDGRLVISTLHSDNVFTGIQRIASLASDKIGSNEAHELLAESFRIGMHQKLYKEKLRTTCLLDTQTVFNLIREKKINMLKNEWERQVIAFKNGQRIEHRS